MFHPPRHYVFIDAVARTGSIRKAAAQIGVASTSINRKILEIEEQLGVAMFERLPTGVRLTAAGEVLIGIIRRNIADVRSANAQIEQLQGLVFGNINLALAHSVANDLIPELVAQYHKHHPRVKFAFQVGGTFDLIAALMRDEMDLALVHDPAMTSDLTELSSYSQPLCAVMSRHHPLAGRAKLKLVDCQPFPVALGNSSFGGRKLIERILKRTNLSLKVVLESNTIRSQINYARHTEAICFQFQIGTIQDTVNGDLVAIPLSDTELSSGRLVLVQRAGRALPFPAVSFAEAIKNRLAGM